MYRPITVVETQSYLKDARRVFTADEQRQVIDTIAHDPEGGVLLDGGLRKRRFAAKGRGKSGGARVIY
jgi:hypothetical protein